MVAMTRVTQVSRCPGKPCWHFESHLSKLSNAWSFNPFILWFPQYFHSISLHGLEFSGILLLCNIAGQQDCMKSGQLQTQWELLVGYLLLIGQNIGLKACIEMSDEYVNKNKQIFLFFLWNNKIICLIYLETNFDFLQGGSKKMAPYSIQIRIFLKNVCVLFYCRPNPNQFFLVKY